MDFFSFLQTNSSEFGLDKAVIFCNFSEKKNMGDEGEGNLIYGLELQVCSFVLLKTKIYHMSCKIIFPYDFIIGVINVQVLNHV